jgi:hypothetical protein
MESPRSTWVYLDEVDGRERIENEWSTKISGKKINGREFFMI